MKVTNNNWQSETLNRTMYKSVSQREDGEIEEEEAVEVSANQDIDDYLSFPEGIFAKKEEKSQGSYKMKSSTPDDSVGQLASMLARAETRIDVQQVSSKAMRSLANLKMSSMASEGKDKEKIDQMIRRMEKLIKRINKKLQHLSKEEQLENQRKQAEKKQNVQKEIELRKELQKRRTKRRRDERNYASKELAQDQKESSQELMDSLSDLGTSAGVSSLPGMDGTLSAASMASSASASIGYSAAAPVMEGVSVDVSI